MAIITEEDVYGGSFTAFPAGLRVLVVDNDLNCLSCLVHLLQACHYQVTTCRGGVDALSVLRRSKTKFDIVICDIYTPDIDGFKLLEIIQVEMDIPVVIMSKDDSRDVVMKVIFMGACDYLVKPVRKEEISVIWQHVVRKNSKAFMPTLLRSEINLSSDNYQNNNNNKSGEEHCGSSSGHMRSDEGSKNDIVSMKKQRMVWTTELHEQFVAAVNSIGLKCAVPKKILDLMKVPGLTRENVASHLQKYRSYIRRSMDNVGKKACNISSVQTRNVMHPYMMGSSTTTSVQVVAYPPSVTNQLHSQTSVVSQVEMDETERLSAAAGGVNGVPITYYNQSLCYGLQTPPPPPQTAVIHEEEQEILLSMEREQLGLNDENETIQFPLPFSSVIVDCGQSNNNQQQQQQQLGGYNLLNYYDRCSNDGIDQNPSFATVGNNSHYHSEYTFPFYDSVFLPQHYNNIQEGLTGN